MHFRKTTLIGVGLLGGSLGLAIQKRNLSDSVVGYVRREASIDACREYGVVSEATTDLADAVASADLIVMCTPLGQMKPLAEKFLPHIKPGAIVTDVGSVKEEAVDELEAVIASANAIFVGSHPMAGSERTGPGAARENLFENAITIVTPTGRTPDEATQKVEELWQSVGARTIRLSPDLHDNLTSRCSHLPHIVAAGLANYILSPAHPTEQGELCATGFRDTTRIASGSPEMWRDIVMSNRKHLLRVLSVFTEDLNEFQLALERNDVDAIVEFFEIAKQRRDQWQNEFNQRSESPSE